MNANDFVIERLCEMGVDVKGYDIHIHDVPLSTILLHGGPNITRRTSGLAVHCGKRHDIYLLSTLDDTRRKGTLAHELGHVWLQEHRSPFRQSRIENEGFCELLCYKMYGLVGNLEAYAIRGRMLISRTPVYSEGFRMMKRRAEELGWEAFLAAAKGRCGERAARFVIRPAASARRTFTIVDDKKLSTANFSIKDCKRGGTGVNFFAKKKLKQN